ncbi:MAG: DNA-directed RNA polymerase subunit omega [Rhodospirillales bacterium]|nr:DNA-directed RNA polymerase subunit omega [Rhodospirillales bacterium]
MARVTVEDCVTRIPNRFELVMLAAQRGRNIAAGAPLAVDRDNDKNAVVALREIADARVDLKDLENGLIRGLQTIVESDDPEGEEIDLLPLSEDGGEEVVDEIGEERGEAQASEEMREDELYVEDEGAAVAEGEDDVDAEADPDADLGDDEPEAL